MYKISTSNPDRYIVVTQVLDDCIPFRTDSGQLYMKDFYSRLIVITHVIDDCILFLTDWDHYYDERFPFLFQTDSCHSLQPKGSLQDMSCH